MRLLLSLSIIALLAGCDATDSADAVVADAATVTVVPVDFSGEIPCSGEFVTLNGTARFVDHARPDGSGGFHVTQQTRVHADGSGSHGNDYRFNYSDNVSTNVQADGLPYSETRATTWSIPGKGQAPNYNVRSTFHFTINSNGDMTSDVLNIRFTCS